MRKVSVGCLLLCGLLSVHAAYPCQPSTTPEFDDVAPTAADILAFQVLALELDTQSTLPYNVIRAKIKVLKRYRGAGDFTEMRYYNTVCGGLRLDVGGLYLVATNSAAPTIELDSKWEQILWLAGTSPHDPEVILRVSHTVKRLESALRGTSAFDVATEVARAPMSIYTPPPPVPPPEQF